MFHPTDPSESSASDPVAPRDDGRPTPPSRPAGPPPADANTRAREAKAIAFLRQIESLSEPELLSRLRGMVVRERRSTTQLLAHLAVADMRRAFVPQGYSSLFNYCTRALHFSEQAAYLRIAAARVVRRFPAVLARVADGSVHLTALALLRPHLTGENHRRLLDAARHRSRREIEDLVAAWRVGPPDPPRARFDVLAAAAPRPGLGAGAPLPFQGDFGGHDSAWRRRPDAEQGWWRRPTGSCDDDADERAVSAPRYVDDCDEMSAEGGVDDPGFDTGHRLDFGDSDDDSSDRHVRSLRGEAPAGHFDAGPRPGGPEPVYRLHITIPAETRRKLDQAAELLRHQIPDGDPALIIDRALGVLLDRLEQRKFARVLARPQAGIGVRPAVMPMTSGSEVGAAPVEPPAADTRAATSKDAVQKRESPGERPDSEPSRETAMSETPASETPMSEPPMSETPGESRTLDLPSESRALEPAAASPAAEAPSDAHSGRRRGYILAVVRRAVWERDGGRCTFVGIGGERCDQVGLLEYHHRIPWAAGGPDTFDNLELRCRTHNEYESQLTYGRTARGTPTPDERAFDPSSEGGPGDSGDGDADDDPGPGNPGDGDADDDPGPGNPGDGDAGDDPGRGDPADGDPTRFGPSST